MYHCPSFEATGITEEEGGGEEVMTMIVTNFQRTKWSDGLFDSTLFKCKDVCIKLMVLSTWERRVTCSTSKTAAPHCPATSHLNTAAKCRPPTLPGLFPMFPRIPVGLLGDHSDCLIRAHVFKERKYSGFPTSRNILLRLLSNFPWTFIITEYLLTTCYGC